MENEKIIEKYEIFQRILTRFLSFGYRTLVLLTLYLFIVLTCSTILITGVKYFTPDLFNFLINYLKIDVENYNIITHIQNELDNNTNELNKIKNELFELKKEKMKLEHELGRAIGERNGALEMMKKEILQNPILYGTIATILGIMITAGIYYFFVNENSDIFKK